MSLQTTTDRYAILTLSSASLSVVVVPVQERRGELGRGAVVALAVAAFATGTTVATIATAFAARTTVATVAAFTTGSAIAVASVATRATAVTARAAIATVAARSTVAAFT